MDILTWKVQGLLLLRALTAHPRDQEPIPVNRLPKICSMSWWLTPVPHHTP